MGFSFVVTSIVLVICSRVMNIMVIFVMLFIIMNIMVLTPTEVMK